MKRIAKVAIWIIILGVFIVLFENRIWREVKNQEIQKMKISDDEFRSQFYSKDLLENNDKLSSVCKSFLGNVEKDVSYFPVAESSVDKAYKTTFVNTWMSDRTYGGKRGHEGIDIMASVNKRGVYPIISMVDGVVTNLGWLEKGGYRIGITSNSGIYYYYAHLDSYSNLREGQRVRAGEILGYMGDSGYGPEGTKGKFPVHLHVGIYLYENGKEISVNPYYILCYLENKKLKYAYS